MASYKGNITLARINDGKNGINGTNGRGVIKIEEEYYASSSPVKLEGGSWSPTPPSFETGIYIWTRSKITYSNPVEVKFLDPVCSTGHDGKNGTNGSDGYTPIKGVDYFDGKDGVNGSDGTSSFLHIRYSNFSDGTNFIDKPSQDTKYIGISITNSSLAPSLKTDYKWSKYIGENGAQGLPGNDGISSFIHIAYSNSPDGIKDFSLTDATNKSYIGSYTDKNEKDSESPSDYNWAKMRGEDGKNGENGANGDPGISVDKVDVLYKSLKKEENNPTPPTPSDLNGWTTDAPAWKKGYNIWSITETSFSDGKKTYTSPVRVSGEDGENGTNSREVVLETVQDEILKFKEKDKLFFSPDELTSYVFKYEQNQKTPYPFNIYAPTVEIYYQDRLGDLNETYGQDGYNKRVNIVTLLGNKFFIDVERNCFIFKIKEFIELTPEEVLANANQNKLALELQERIKEESGFLNLVVNFKEGNIILNGYASIRFGVSSEMATFNLTASGFNAAVRDSKLVFSENGLTIKNSGIRIVDEASKEVFYADDNGTLNAENLIVKNGSFSGELKAESGTIGGFTIEKDEQGNSWLKSNEANPGIILDGTKGEIKAKKIEIGDQARIASFIELSDSNQASKKAALYNPSVSSGKVLEIVKNDSTTFLLDDNGILSLGSLKLNGETSSIEDTKGTWKIKEGSAEFNNITASGTITTAIFEKGSVQTFGSAVIFKDSYYFTINNISNNIVDIETEKENNLNIGDFVLIESEQNKNKAYGKITFKNLKAIKIQLLNDISPFKSGEKGLLVFLASQGAEERQETLTNDLIIGINAASSKFSMLPGEGISIIAPTLNQTKEINSISYNIPNIFLGNLNQLKMPAINGYGLYGDNVFLNGSLTTKRNNIFSGINTNNNQLSIFSSENSIYPGYEDNSSLIFWAGARLSEDGEILDIKEVPFQVTENGSLFAKNGVFSGTISSSTIESSRIISKDWTQSLRFYDRSNIGIEFMKLRENKDNVSQYSSITEIFNPNDYERNLIIGANGIAVPKLSEDCFSYNSNINETNLDYVLKINIFDEVIEGGLSQKRKEIEIVGNNIFSDMMSTEEIYAGNFKISKNTISYDGSEPNGNYLGLDFDTSQLVIRNKNLALPDKDLFLFSSDEMISYSDVSLKKNLVLGGANEHDTLVEFKKVEGGYDIYVT